MFEFFLKRMAPRQGGLRKIERRIHLTSSLRHPKRQGGQKAAGVIVVPASVNSPVCVNSPAVADANGIEYNPTECHHKGRCPGTCPVCDAEVEAINKALKRKVALGEEIVIPEFDIEDLCLSGVDTNPMNPFAGEARTPDDIKRIHEEYDIPYDEDDDECGKEQGDIASEPFALMGELISPIEEMVHGNLEIPEVLGVIIAPPNDDEEEETDE